MQSAEKAQWLAARSYRFRPCDGKVTVLANEEWYRKDPTLGWRDLATDGVKVHKIPGNHFTYITDNVHLVAKALRECLENAEARS